MWEGNVGINRHRVGCARVAVYASMSSIEDDNSHSVEKVKITLGKILCYTQISWNDMINNQSYNYFLMFRKKNKLRSYAVKTHVSFFNLTTL